jgi:hypothetical protein
VERCAGPADQTPPLISRPSGSGLNDVEYHDGCLSRCCRVRFTDATIIGRKCHIQSSREALNRCRDKLNFLLRSEANPWYV